MSDNLEGEEEFEQDQKNEVVSIDVEAEKPPSKATKKPASKPDEEIGVLFGVRLKKVDRENLAELMHHYGVSKIREAIVRALHDALVYVKDQDSENDSLYTELDKRMKKLEQISPAITHLDAALKEREQKRLQLEQELPAPEEKKPEPEKKQKRSKSRYTLF